MTIIITLLAIIATIHTQATTPPIIPVIIFAPDITDYHLTKTLMHQHEGTIFERSLPKDYYVDHHSVGQKVPEQHATQERTVPTLTVQNGELKPSKAVGKKQNSSVSSHWIYICAASAVFMALILTYKKDQITLKPLPQEQTETLRG